MSILKSEVFQSHSAHAIFLVVNFLCFLVFSFFSYSAMGGKISVGNTLLDIAIFFVFPALKSLYSLTYGMGVASVNYQGYTIAFFPAFMLVINIALFYWYACWVRPRVFINNALVRGVSTLYVWVASSLFAIGAVVAVMGSLWGSSKEWSNVIWSFALVALVGIILVIISEFKKYSRARIAALRSQ